MEQRITNVESGLLTHHEKTFSHDEDFRPLIVADQLRGEIHSKGYDCCDLEWETAGDGAATVYERDVLGRVIGQQRGYKGPLEPGNTLDVLTSQQRFHLDGRNRRIATHDLALDGSGWQESTRAYNLAAQPVARTDTAGVVTRQKTVMLEGGGRLEITSLPRSGHDNRYRISQPPIRSRRPSGSRAHLRLERALCHQT